MDEFSLLMTGGDGFQPALTLGADLPKKMGKHAVSYKTKEAIRVGEFVAGQGISLSVTKNRIDDWVKKFKEMQKAGVKVPVPSDHSDKAEDQRGWVYSAKRDGDSLILGLQLIGEDADLEATRNDVSLKIGSMVDGNGVKWTDAILHCALTPIPVIPGQSEAEHVAASRQHGDDTTIFMLSLRSKPMPQALTKELVDRMKKIPGLDSATEENGIDCLLSHMEALCSKNVSLARVETLVAELAERDTHIGRCNEALIMLKTAKETVDAKVVELSRGPAVPDPEVLADRAELSLSRIDLAIERGDMPPVIAAKVKKMVKDGNTVNSFMLSRNAEIGTRPIDAILDLFDGLKLANMDGKSKAQLLSRETPKDGNETDTSQAGNRMIEVAQKMGYVPPTAAK